MSVNAGARSKRKKKWESVGGSALETATIMWQRTIAERKSK